MSILLGASRSAARIVVLTAPRVVNWRSPTVSAHSARSVGINWREASQAWQQLSKVSPVSQCRLFHSSTQIWKKGTQEKRASRLANAAGVNPDSAEFATLQQLLKQAQEQQQKEKAKESAEVEVTLFEIDRQKLFIFATGACILIFVLFLGTAEFMFNWYMTMDETTGELVEAPVFFFITAGRVLYQLLRLVKLKDMVSAPQSGNSASQTPRRISKLRFLFPVAIKIVITAFCWLVIVCTGFVATAYEFAAVGPSYFCRVWFIIHFFLNFKGLATVLALRAPKGTPSTTAASKTSTSQSHSAMDASLSP
eukprot:TRINITY_DN6672_c0_g1_i2.p1 TRINITY_DN6672_c0_g1~~TRINITY_DN6672_c0_g1_i2.p1  ORF type:complete len:309 (+),score=47.62 TRINITY_DN6672_c0_g1_i2:163-1089(+)